MGGSWSLLGRSLGVLGAFLGAPGAVLGRSLGVLGRSWGSFGAPGALLLEVFWSPLRAAWQNHENLKNPCFFNGFSMFFRVPGSQNRSKIVAKSLQEPLGHQVGRRKAPKVTWEAPLARLGSSWIALRDHLGGRAGDRILRRRLPWARAGPPGGRGRGCNTLKDCCIEWSSAL